MSLKIKDLNWVDPLQIAALISCNYDKNWTFLYSGLNDEIKNSRSIIALFLKEELFLNDLKDLKKYLTKDAQSYENCYFGYVSYEYKNHLEKLTQNKKSFINLEEIYFANFSLILEFDHDRKSLKAYFERHEELEEVLNYSKKTSYFCDINVMNLQSNFSSSEYLKTIDEIKKMIVKGDFYQTNLTRKFFGKINIFKHEDFFNIFARLVKSSSANYSSFMKIGDNFLISASPELFLQAANNYILSRPIKGTAPRSPDEKQDKKNRKYLQNSDKEKAENLMIVDLVRNDLSKICKAASVKVKNLFKINSYKTLHHMSSEIIGEIEEDKDALDAFEACFPAGSMTGAPKIKAMEIAAKKEKINRGVYSGAIGYFKGLDDMNFSVVIRTLVCHKNKNDSDFEFQVGGAITYESNSQNELEETFVKAKAICEALNLKIDD